MLIRSSERESSVFLVERFLSPTSAYIVSDILFRVSGGYAPNTIEGKKNLLIKAPASIANLGPGFDILALALKGLYDTVSITISPGTGLIQVVSSGYDVPSGRDNVAYAVAREFTKRFSARNLDIYIEVQKGVPPACGLGSSAATAAAVAYGLSKALGITMSDEDLLHLAGIGELHASGSLHYDNVAASLFGGIVIVDVESKTVLRKVPEIQVPLAVVTPLLPGLRGLRKTEYARSLLPRCVALETHVRQSSALAKLLFGLMTNNLELVGKAMSIDYVAEPYRSKLIPHYFELKQLALSHGALGFNISGAGPSVFLVHRTMEEAKNTALVLAEFLESKGVETTIHVSTISPKGVELVGERSEEN